MSLLKYAYDHHKAAQALMSLALLGISLPPFWVGLILIILFTLVLRWLPATGMLSATGGAPKPTSAAAPSACAAT